MVLKKLAKVDTHNDVRYYSERYLEGTRESIFVKVNSWLDDRSSPNRVMVISGNAGMGKSVIAGEMCKRMQEAGRLSVNHFCRHDKARHRNPKVMLQSLVSHLSSCLPEYRKTLVDKLSRNLVVDINDMEVADLLHAENHELMLEDLVQKTEGVILCAQFLVDFIKKNFSILTLEQLDSTLPSGISSVYQSYFKRLESELCKELKITEDQFFSFLSAITVSREPLPLGFVIKLLFDGILSPAVQRKVNQAIACISSLLPVYDGCIHFFHKSVKDWLTDKSFYRQHNFNVDEREGHRILSRLCIDVFDDVIRKGVDASQPFSDTTKYALQHGVQHMLQLNEDARSYSLDEVASNYVLNIELVYAKLCANSTTASDDIVSVTKQERLNPLSVDL